MSLSQKTVKRLREVQAHILANPEHFDMRTYWDTPFGISMPKHPKLAGPVCQTTACIAGTAVVLFDKKADVSTLDDGFEMGRRMLGLTKSQAARLFYHDSWPYKYYDLYEEALDKLDRSSGARPDPADYTVAQLDEYTAALDAARKAQRPSEVKAAKIAARRIDHFIKTDGEE